MFRPTLRPDGTLRVAIRTTHYLLRGEVVALLGDLYAFDVIMGHPPHLTRSNIEIPLRNYVAYHGERRVADWTSYYSESEVKRVEGWANDLLDRLGWPE